jgi:hypothetical protein
MYGTLPRCLHVMMPSHRGKWLRTGNQRCNKIEDNYFVYFCVGAFCGLLLRVTLDKYVTPCSSSSHFSCHSSHLKSFICIAE